MFSEKGKSYLYIDIIKGLNNRSDKIKKIFAEIKYCLMHRYVIDCEKNSDLGTYDYIFLISLFRQDYCDFISAIYNQCNLKKKFINIKNCKKNNFKFVYHLWTLRKWYNKAQYVYLSNENNKNIKVQLGKLDSIILYIYLVRFAQAEILFGQEKGYCTKNIVVMNDVWNIEGDIILHAKKYGIKTICLQHALYLPNASTSYIHNLNWKVLICDVYMLWGHMTKEMMNINNLKSELLICGNPLLERKETLKKQNLIGVVFDLPEYHVYNQQLIDMAEIIGKKMNFKIVLRIHPADSIQHYNYDSTITQKASEIKNAAIILGHTTTMLFTYMVMGMKVLRMVSDIPFFDLDSKFLFSNLDELQEKILWTLQADSTIFRKEAVKYITYIGEESKKEYSNAFMQFV